MTCAGRERSGCSNGSLAANAKVWDRHKVVIIPDHYIFTADSLSNRNVDILRQFVQEQDLPYFYDVIDDPDGSWKFDPSQGMLKRQYGIQLRGGVPHGAAAEGAYAAGGDSLWDRFAYVHGGRV